MVTHQDVGVNSQVVFAGSVVEQVEKVMSVIIVDNDCTAIHTVLNDVQGHLGQFETGMAWHVNRLGPLWGHTVVTRTIVLVRPRTGR